MLEKIKKFLFKKYNYSKKDKIIWYIIYSILTSFFLYLVFFKEIKSYYTIFLLSIVYIALGHIILQIIMYLKKRP